MLSLEGQIGIAILLDLLLGDPRFLPHPVRLIGKLALGAEGVSRRLLSDPYLAGGVSVVVVLGVTAGLTAGLLQFATWIHPLCGAIISIIVLYTTLAAKDLTNHSQAVYSALREGDIPLARSRVAMMVGRDTACLDEAGIILACVESVAENMVDGVTAPLFFAVCFGPVGAMVYKAINTMDSTFGYKNERYMQFGWCAAKLDDLVNFIPARITGLLVIPAAALCRFSAGEAFRIFRRDRLKHSSPNSGHTEAAVAGALGLRMGGRNFYFGQAVEKPFIGDPRVLVTPDHIRDANRLLLLTSALAFLLFLLFRLGFRALYS